MKYKIETKNLKNNVQYKINIKQIFNVLSVMFMLKMSVFILNKITNFFSC